MDFDIITLKLFTETSQNVLPEYDANKFIKRAISVYVKKENISHESWNHNIYNLSELGVLIYIYGYFERDNEYFIVVISNNGPYASIESYLFSFDKNGRMNGSLFLAGGAGDAGMNIVESAKSRNDTIYAYCSFTLVSGLHSSLYRFSEGVSRKESSYTMYHNTISKYVYSHLSNKYLNHSNIQENIYGLFADSLSGEHILIEDYGPDGLSIGYRKNGNYPKFIVLSINRYNRYDRTFYVQFPGSSVVYTLVVDAQNKSLTSTGSDGSPVQKFTAIDPHTAANK